MEPKYTLAQLESDDLSKKELVMYLQEVGSIDFQVKNKLKGQVKNVAKTKSKEALILNYNELFEDKVHYISNNLKLIIIVFMI